eukprot:6001641-Pleurochrysis_carterae.AAC.1
MVCFEWGRFRHDVVGRPGLDIHSQAASWSPSFQEKHVKAGCNRNSHAFRGSTSSQIVAKTIKLLRETASELPSWFNGKDSRFTTFLLKFADNDCNYCAKVLRCMIIMGTPTELTGAYRLRCPPCCILGYGVLKL